MPTSHKNTHHFERPQGGMVALLIWKTLSRPAWLMALFLLLACLLPFAGATSPFRGDSTQIMDPFGFSLLTPSKHAFGPREMLAFAMFLIIPAAMIDWRQFVDLSPSLACSCVMPEWVIPTSASSLYALFLLLALPVLTRSSVFPGPAALWFTVGDLLFRAIAMAWAVDFAMIHTSVPRLRALVGWMIAGALHLGISISDAFLIAPQAMEIVQVGWTSLAWHGLLAIAAVTLHALPIPIPRTRATL